MIARCVGKVIGSLKFSTNWSDKLACYGKRKDDGVFAMILTIVLDGLRRALCLAITLPPGEFLALDGFVSRAQLPLTVAQVRQLSLAERGRLAAFSR